MVGDDTVSASTTLKSHAEMTTYVVYPSNGTDQDQVGYISSQLQNIVLDPWSVYASNIETFGLNY